MYSHSTLSANRFLEHSLHLPSLVEQADSPSKPTPLSQLLNVAVSDWLGFLNKQSNVLIETPSHSVYTFPRGIDLEIPHL